MTDRRRVVVRAFGDPAQLQIEPMTDTPRPKVGELLVDVEASGISYLDVYQRKGSHGAPLPYYPGLEGVGRVREAGPGANVGVGTRVACIDAPGSYASVVVVPAARAIPMPNEFTVSQSLLFQALTAYDYEASLHGPYSRVS